MLVLASVCAILVTIVTMAIGDAGKVKYRVLEKASFSTFSEEIVAGYRAFNCFSESVYSTKQDKKLLDACKVFDDKAKFTEWLDETRDIRQVYPPGAEESSGLSRMTQGYIPVVVSAAALQDSQYEVLVKGIYLNGGNVIVRLGYIRRNSYYRFDRSPDSECKQIYTIFYLKTEQINKIEKFSFAIDRE